MNLNSLHLLLREELFQPESAVVWTRIQRRLSGALLLPWWGTGIFASEPLLTSCVHLLSMERTSSICKRMMATCPNTTFARLHGTDRGANDLLDESECIQVPFRWLLFPRPLEILLRIIEALRKLARHCWRRRQTSYKPCPDPRNQGFGSPDAYACTLLLCQALATPNRIRRSSVSRKVETVACGALILNANVPWLFKSKLGRNRSSICRVIARCGTQSANHGNRTIFTVQELLRLITQQSIVHRRAKARVANNTRSRMYIAKDTSSWCSTRSLSNPRDTGTSGCTSAGSYCGLLVS